MAFWTIFWYSGHHSCMKRSVAFVVCASLLLVGCSSLKAPPGALLKPPPRLVSPERLPVRSVVVDAGHGGHDPGAMHHGLKEKDLTLDIARRLRTQLRGHGLLVTMTRETDDFVALSRRPGVANRMAADLFVSVHINANRSRHVSGVEVYYPRESSVDAEAAFPPHVEPAEVALPTTTIRRVLWDLVLSRTRRDSARMALQICRAMRARLGVRCRWVRGARFVVLREARMPAVLVEVGYLSNRPEASRLASPAYRQTVAQAIAEGLLAYIRGLGLQHI